ncbi:cell wall-binding repeat-containing protein [Actinokineospora soli]|uniref:Cell wall-binding repeat-containing protein n=1 Tax=Actinokineospora soli TaxID=1048753 RepID=A0ABW2TH12_9PSEU
MAGGPLAAHLGAPLLLTSPTALLADVRDEIKRVLGDDGGTVYLLGGTGSLSAGVESSITSLGYTAKRLAGADRYQTAIKIAEAMPVTSKFFVTTGTNFPDALAAGSAAAHLNRGGQTWALLFTNDTRMPASTAAFANARKAQVGDWTLVTAAARPTRPPRARSARCRRASSGRTGSPRPCSSRTATTRTRARWWARAWGWPTAPTSPTPSRARRPSRSTASRCC